MSSSPFELFRRNLKPLMVVLTLLALLSFVVLPSVLMYQQNQMRSGMTDTKLATYKGGDFELSRVNYFTRNHYATVRFLDELAKTTMARGGVPKVADFQYDSQQKFIRELGINSQPSDPASVQTMMFAAEAKKVGLDLDDTAIRNWLTLYSDGRLSDSEINGILSKSTQNQIGQVQLYEQLRSQLLATAYRRSVLSGLTSGGGLPLVPPAQQWELFLRLNRRATADAYAVNIADFIEKTNATPPEKQINDIYEEGKSVYPNDQSPKPGFRRFYTANIEYLAGSLNEFIAREKAKLTEEQLRAEYQKRLDGGDYKLPDLPATEAPATEAPAAEVPAAEAPATETPSTETSSTETPAAESPAMKAPTEAAPAVETPAETPATETKVDTPAAEPASEATTEKPAEADSSYVAPTTDTVRLVAFQAADEPPPAETTSPPSTEQPAVPKVEAFEKVRDDIAESLAMQPALNKLDAAVTEIDKVLRTYSNARALAGGKAEKIPPRPDLKTLAEKLGMTHVVTGMVNGIDISPDPISLSFGAGSGMTRGGSFVQTVFAQQPPTPLFISLRTVDDQARVSYVSWKTEDKPDYIPELKEIRDEVITTIRNIEARKFARDEAERLAKEFTTSDKPAKELIPTERTSMYFESLGPFSWMNSLGFGMRAYIGNVPELDNVGDDFMRQVFTAERDKWGVAANQPETVYYVVRPTEFSPSTDELHQRFMQLSQRMQAFALARDETTKIQSGYYEALDKRNGFKWNEAALANQE